MAAPVHLFGIRHHGPGSARRLVEALDALRPAAVLIEGPADLSDLLPLLAAPETEPPVALLAYAADDPSRTVFWPFAEFSPEFQAARWAVGHGAPVRFIDLSAASTLAEPEPDAAATEVVQVGEAAPKEDALAARLERDPIGVLAEAAGYEDGESWWTDVVEENPEPGPVFAAVAEAMVALRETAPAPESREAAREAHMRLEIARTAREASGPVAVVCGAWHVPALKSGATAADRELLKGAPKRKLVATLAPWTSPRLAYGSGYRAGVAAPGWCAHLWRTPPGRRTTLWLARVAAALRAEGRLVSTASLIEAERLATALAAVRGRPSPGFEELRDAAVSGLCFGEPAVWETVARPLLLGSEVGRVPPGAPAAPLLEDLQREQRRLRLKPEALERELALDLRTEAGLERSTLLHRLAILDAPWGRLTDAGRSRGTFRERWVLRWDPEFSVRLVDNLVYGATLARAAAAKAIADLERTTELGRLCDLALSALTAQLPEAARRALTLMEERAARTADVRELLEALPPLGSLVRYGQARRTDAEQLSVLFARLVVQSALALPYAARGLDTEAAATLRTALLAADAAVALAEVGADEADHWFNALETLANDSQSTPLLAGTAVGRLLERGSISGEHAADLLGRALTPGRAVAQAADYLEGFFTGAGERLIYDGDLRAPVDVWLQSLEPEAFTAHLPLFRRAFSDLDRMQRRRLLDALFGRRAGGLSGRVLAPDAASIWPEHAARIAAVLSGGGAR